MLRDGANNNTETELNNLIKDLSLTKYKNIEKVLSVANSIFIRDEFKDGVKTDYINTLKNNYDAEVIFDPFEDATNVNNWISDKTFNIINNMLQDDYFEDPDLKMVLVNALAIDMEWRIPFDCMSTYNEKFTKVNGEQIEVAMMHNGGYDNAYYKDEDYSAITLPLMEYEGTKLEFVAVMPEKQDLHSFVTSDTFEKNLDEVLNKMAPVEGNKVLSVAIPRFEYNYSTSLVGDLKKLGINDIFGANADLKKMSDEDLHVDAVLHKADIKLSEKGIKAAAVTVAFVSANSVDEPIEREYVVVKFDKPFMYIIRDAETKEVWFAGTVYEPILWSEVAESYNTY
jgi:serine protease inhibitor